MSDRVDISGDNAPNTKQVSSFSLKHWRNIYVIFSLILRFVLCLQPSYIHPDEFFQSFQPLYDDNIPWEFAAGSSSRSYGPLLLLYWPIIKISQYFGLKPIVAYYLTRLEFCYLSWIIIDHYIYKILPIKQERMKALFFINTSYVTLCYQSHTFSNSIETVLLIVVLSIINDVRISLSDKTLVVSKSRLFVLGLLVSFGIFNRITFAAWLLIPSIFLLKFFIKHPLTTFFTMVPGFLALSLVMVVLDTYMFTENAQVLSDLEVSNWVLTPLNNLLYNSDIDNLSKHGLHPYYQHILVNYPTMIGPLILFLFPFNKTYIATTPFLSLLSGVILLSLIPHQELRFLQPIIPLVGSCVDLNMFATKKNFSRFLITLWLVFNLVFCLIMGVFHQGGLIYAIDELHDRLGKSTPSETGYTLIFWRTYKPPTFLLEQETGSLLGNIYLNKDEDDLPSIDYTQFLQNGDKNIVLDLMGTPMQDVKVILNNVKDTNSENHPVYFVAPLSSCIDPILNSFQQDMRLEWSSFWHYDLDHFEPDQYGLQTFKPGIGIYQLI